MKILNFTHILMDSTEYLRAKKYDASVRKEDRLVDLFELVGELEEFYKRRIRKARSAEEAQTLFEFVI